MSKETLANDPNKSGTENRVFISVIISNFNGEKYLPRLLETLASQKGVELEIIVVDRNSSDGSAAILSRWSNLKVVQEAPDSGLVTGYDVGSKHAQHDLLFFANEDMWFDENCLRRLAEGINMDQRIASTDPWQWTYNGEKRIHGGVRFARTAIDVSVAYPFRTHLNTVELPKGTSIPFGCAGAIMIHRQAYIEAGGWDRGFFLDHEDVDLFLRLWRLDYKCITISDAKVYHAVGMSNTKTVSSGTVSRRRYISGRSSMLLIPAKHFSITFMPIAFAVHGLLILKHLVTLNFRNFYWSILAIGEFRRRLPDALAYRRASAALIAKRPGELFFTEQAFQDCSPL